MERRPEYLLRTWITVTFTHLGLKNLAIKTSQTGFVTIVPVGPKAPDLCPTGVFNF